MRLTQLQRLSVCRWLWEGLGSLKRFMPRRRRAPSCSRPLVRRWHRFRAWSTHSGRSSATITATWRDRFRAVDARSTGTGEARQTHQSCPRRSMDSSSIVAHASPRAEPGSCRRRWKVSQQPSTTAGYVRFFQAFSPVRLFSTMEANVTFARFFVPGGGEVRATTNAFGAVFSDVDRNDGLDNRFVFDKDGVRRAAKVATSISFLAHAETCCSARPFQRRKATRACPSSASYSRVHALPPSGSRRGTPPRTQNRLHT